MNQMSARQMKRAAIKKKQTKQKILTFGGFAIAAVVLLAVVWFAAQAANSGGLMGDEVVIPSRDHVASNTTPGPYNSNPPAGGAHFETNWREKFFQESELPTLPPHPEGYLVHSLEHGYVIFWYNCQIAGTDCAALKQSIQKVMDATGKTKLIAFPWASQDVPLAMTSWGRILKFTSINEDLMQQFVRRNRYQAPEPEAS
jgi:hypothetical protein